MNRTYILIAGQGRSGTNFLLRLLDLSPVSHCRNEPNELSNSPFHSLPPGWLRVVDSAQLEQRWDSVVSKTALSIGTREHEVVVRKNHLRELSRRMGGHRVFSRPKIRRMLRLIEPLSETPVPSWLGRKDQLLEAVPVMKFTQVAGWAGWAVQHRPGARLLHIVRHPGGFLNSWRNRYLSTVPGEDVARANQERLEAIRTRDPEWSTILPDIESMSVDESELWYWRYATDTIHDAGEGLPNYLLVNYDRLAGTTMETVLAIFEFCGLPWSEDIAGEVKTMSLASRETARAWKDRLSAEDLDLVNRVLAGSRAEHWWD